MRPARTILAVLLGFFVWLAVFLLGGLFFAVVAARSGYTQWMLIGEVVSFVAGVAAGAVAARVASERPLLHAGVLGVVMICVLTLVTAFTKHRATTLPSWYPYAAAVLTGAGAFVGGALSTRPKRGS